MSSEATPPPGGVLLHVDLPGLSLGDGPLHARAGDQIHLQDAEGGEVRSLIRRLLELSPSSDPRPDSVWVRGENLRSLTPRRRRELVGYAAAGTIFERGTLARALHYRRPDLDGAMDLPVLDAVGLDARRLPRGVRTPLRRGGEPLGRSDRARLALGRAIYGTPPLLIIDALEGDLDEDGRQRLEQILDGYRGVVLLAGSSALARRIGARCVIVSAPASGSPADGPLASDGSEDVDGE